MARIPAAICRIYRNSFKRHYLIKKRLFLDFLLHFLNVHQISSIFKKNHESPTGIISEIIDCERRGYLTLQKVLLQNTIRDWTC